MRDGQPDLACRGWPSTDQLDQGGARDRSKDEAERQEAEFARRHVAGIARVVLLPVRGTVVDSA